MRNFIKNLTAYYLSLFLIASYLGSDVKIEGGFAGYTKVVLILTLLFPLIKPLLNLIFLPLSLLTLGMFGFFIDFVLVYLLSILVPEFKVQNLFVSGLNYPNLSISAFTLSRFWTILLLSFQISILHKIFRWLLK